MFSFIASNARSAPKRRRPLLPPHEQWPSNAKAPKPVALAHEYMLDTKGATVALREVMRIELAEVEEESQREAKHMCCAPSRRGEFLLAASIIVQRRPDISVSGALDLAQRQFVDQRVRQALQNVQDKWKEIFERPPEFRVQDERQKQLEIYNQRLKQEEQADISEAQARVCKLCMYLTAGGKYIEEWKSSFAECGALKRNGGVWTPNQFAIAVKEIALTVSGCKVPEGVAMIIYDYLDTRSSRLLNIDTFFELCTLAVHLEKMEKEAKNLTKAKVKLASKAAAQALQIDRDPAFNDEEASEHEEEVFVSSTRESEDPNAESNCETEPILMSEVDISAAHQLASHDSLPTTMKKYLSHKDGHASESISASDKDSDSEISKDKDFFAKEEGTSVPSDMKVEAKSKSTPVQSRDFEARKGTTANSPYVVVNKRSSSESICETELEEAVVVPSPRNGKSGKSVSGMRTFFSKVVKSLSPLRIGHAKAKAQSERQQIEKEEQLQMRKEIESLRIRLEEVSKESELRLAKARAADIAMHEAMQIAKAAQTTAQEAVAKMTQLVNEQKFTQDKQREMIAAIQSAGFIVGQKVRARFAGRGHFYPAVITAADHKNELYDVRYADGDRERNVAKKHLRLIIV